MGRRNQPPMRPGDRHLHRFRGRIAAGLEPAPQRIHVLSERRGARIAILGPLGYRPLDDRVEPSRNLGHRRREGSRLPRQDRLIEGFTRRGSERGIASHHLVERGTEGVDVGPRIGSSAGEHFGRHVLRRPEDFLQRSEDSSGEMRDSEVEDLRAAVRCDHDVVGLDVAMHKPELVRGRKPRCNIVSDRECLIDGESPLEEDVAQRTPASVLHDQVQAVAVFDYLEQHDDIWVIDLGDGLGFAQEACAILGAPKTACLERLDGNGLAGSLEVFGPVDLAHRAFAHLLENPVASERAGHVHWKRSASVCESI